MTNREFGCFDTTSPAQTLRENSTFKSSVFRGIIL